MACWMNLPFYVKAYTEVVLTENSCFCFLVWLNTILLALLDSNGVICFEVYILWLILSSDYDIFVNK